MAAIVRDREPDDLDVAASALIEVHRLAGYPVEGVDGPVAWLSPAGLLHAWVAVLDDTVVGHAVSGQARGPQEPSPQVQRSPRTTADGTALVTRPPRRPAPTVTSQP